MSYVLLLSLIPLLILPLYSFLGFFLMHLEKKDIQFDQLLRDILLMKRRVSALVKIS